jgi:hypothetical protein
VPSHVGKEKLTIAGHVISSIQADHDEQVLVMSRRLGIVIAAGLALSGCCIGSGCYIQPPTGALAGWDGLGPLPKHSNLKTAKFRNTSGPVGNNDDSPNEEELAGLKPYSMEWWTVRDAIDHAADVKLSRKLIICRDCMPPEPPDDQTGSIAPQ